jgi:hypothetical protein
LATLTELIIWFKIFPYKPIVTPLVKKSSAFTKPEVYIHFSQKLIIPEDYAKQESTMKQSLAFCLLHGGFLLGLILYPEDGGKILLRNVP